MVWICKGIFKKPCQEMNDDDIMVCALCGKRRFEYMTITHNLKTDKEVFELSWDGRKPFEIRFDDRDFQVGDELVLFETAYSGQQMKEGKPLVFTGRRIRQKVLSKVSGNYGIKNDWCVLGLAELHRENSPVNWDVPTLSYF